jgi:hypothetical protein
MGYYRERLNGCQVSMNLSRTARCMGMDDGGFDPRTGGPGNGYRQP